MQNHTPLSRLIHSQAARYGSRRALLWRDEREGRWVPVSWRDFSALVRQAARALLALGVREQECVAVFAQNCPEGLVSDFAAYAVRAATIPLYATSSEAQVKYIASDASLRYVFVGEQYQYDVARHVQQLGEHIERIIVYDPSVELDPRDGVTLSWADFLALGQAPEHDAEVAARTARAGEDDVANILYTSGTTGLSKGVTITHRMYQATFRSYEHVLPLREDDVIMCFLPFSHILERAWSYLCLGRGCTLAVNKQPTRIMRSLQEVRPTCMCVVPRFWEKLYAGVRERMRQAGTVQRRLMQEALDTGREYYVGYRSRGLVPPAPLRMRHAVLQRTVVGALLRKLGLDRHHFFPTAGAAIPGPVEEFVRSLGIDILVGYGLTETTATGTIQRYRSRNTTGSVGRLLPGLEMRIGERGEVLLRGGSVTPGYFRKAEVTALSFDEEGWFHTGDAGFVRGGELFLTDRIKDLFKTSNGKYIAPQMIETKLVVDRYIDQIVVVADRRRFVSALVVPHYKSLEEFARQQGVAFACRAELCKSPVAVRFLMYRIDTLQQEFAHYEQVKRITLLPEPLSLQRGELTDTMKVRRDVVCHNYAPLIDKMYEEE